MNNNAIRNPNMLNSVLEKVVPPIGILDGFFRAVSSATRLHDLSKPHIVALQN